MDSPNHIESRGVPNAGKGVFNTVRIAAGTEVFRVDQPLAYVLDSSNLQTTCANCLRKPSSDEDVDSIEENLKRCMGCKIVKYCGTNCQRESFRLGHRYECKIFSVLYPNVLPNTVRLLLRLLLRRQNGSLGDKSWSSFLSLESHSTDFQTQQAKNEDGLTTWQTIELMSQATAKYSGTNEQLSNIQGMVARILINSHTLTTPTLDPLGLCLSPPTAHLNHSCTPNTHIVFSGHHLHLRSLAPLPPNTELTISYIDTTISAPARLTSLRSRYFFECHCPSCTASTTNDLPDPPITPNSQIAETSATKLQAEAALLPAPEAAQKLVEALRLLEQEHYPPHRQPYASMLHNAWLNAVARQDWVTAVRYGLRAYFEVEPVQYPLEWHPIRVVRQWVLLKLLVNCAGLVQEGAGSSVEGLGGLGLEGGEWAVVIKALWVEVGKGVVLSHGKENKLAEEVGLMGQGMGGGGEALGKEWETAVKTVWAKLRMWVDEEKDEGQSLVVS